MYCLSNEQIDYIENDIRARGVTMEALQQNLLDHVCCLIEEKLEEDGNFEQFYTSTIQTFYKKELKEIEDETIVLLTNKNYYAMKKIMIFSGIFSAAVLSLGLALKFTYSPGASLCILAGIGSFSLVFLPLMFILKAKEKQNIKDKFIIGLGTMAAILISLSTLFKIMHWPYANTAWLGAMGVLLLLFLPIYFFTGIRNAETKTNTIVSSILLVAGCGLMFTLVVSPHGMKMMSIKDTNRFVINEQVLKTEQKQIAGSIKPDATNSALLALSNNINTTCEELKSFILERETGYKTLDADFVSKNALIQDDWITKYFADESSPMYKLNGLRETVEQYNTANAKLANPNLQPIPVASTILDMRREDKIVGALNSFVQIQMIVLQNERELVAMK